MTPGRRVLFMVEGGDLPHAPGALGYSGFIRYIAGALEHLKDQGVVITFGTTRGRSPLHPVMEEMGIETFSLDCESSVDYPVAAFHLARMIRARRFDTLHLNESIQASIGGAAGVMARRGTRIFHRHHTFIPGPTTRLTRFAGRSCHQTMAVSESVANKAIEEGVAPRRICVALNGVPQPRLVAAEETLALRRELGIDYADPVIVVVGHLRPEKGHPILLRAAELAAAHRGDIVHVVIVGGGPHEAAIHAASQGLKKVRVHMVGHKADVPLWFHLGDVIAVPSLSEPFGLVAVEAMACERPIVASRVDGLCEVIEHGRTGLLVKPADEIALSTAIEELLESRDIAHRMARDARTTYLQEFTIEAMAQRWLHCYERADLITQRKRVGTA